MKKQVFLNVLFTLIYQLTYAISGIFVPIIILSTFGSEVNGLTMSLFSFLSIFEVVEGGMAAVIASKIYKPLINGDNKALSEIVASGRSFYKKISVLFFIFVISLGIFFPLIKHTSFSFFYIFSLIFIMGASSFVSYYFYAMLSTIVYADNKSYITYIAYSISTIINILFVVLGVRVFPSIHFIKFLTFVAYLINPIILSVYIKKHYRIDYNTKANHSLLDQRWDAFAHNLSTFVMNNIDIYILTFFSSLINVSIYSIYSIIIVSIRKIVYSVSNVIIPFMGKSKASKTNISDSFNVELFVTGIVTIIVFSCTYVLINPFIKIYTANINDANYINQSFAFLFVTSELIACITFPYINISFATGDFRGTKSYAYIEVVVNVVLSILFVFNFGLIGVITATIISRTLRFVLQILYLRKHELEISIFKTTVSSLEFIVIIFVISYVLKHLISTTINTLSSWFINAFLCLCFSAIICLLCIFLFNKKTTIKLITRFINSKKANNHLD